MITTGVLYLFDNFLDYPQFRSMIVGNHSTLSMNQSHFQPISSTQFVLKCFQTSLKCCKLATRVICRVECFFFKTTFQEFKDNDNHQFLVMLKKGERTFMSKKVQIIGLFSSFRHVFFTFICRSLIVAAGENTPSNAMWWLPKFQRKVWPGMRS